MVDMRAYIGKRVDPRQVSGYTYLFYGDGGGYDHAPVLSILVEKVKGEYFDRSYTLHIHLDLTAKITSVERLSNGYLIKKFPDDVDKKARQIMSDIITTNTRADLMMLKDSAKR